MIGGLNPWISMWANPRSTIRALVNMNPKYGVFYLASAYALQEYLFFASYWSLGLSFPFYAILLLGLVLSPFLGLAWLYFTGWVFSFTGRWLEGKSPSSHLRAAIAWAKIPCVISLLMWLILLIANSDTGFVHDVSWPSATFINFIVFILSVWSLVLLIQSVREVQDFSFLRALLNVVIAWFFSSIAALLVFFIFRYIYTTI